MKLKEYIRKQIKRSLKETVNDDDFEDAEIVDDEPGNTSLSGRLGGSELVKKSFQYDFLKKIPVALGDMDDSKGAPRLNVGRTPNTFQSNQLQRKTKDSRLYKTDYAFVTYPVGGLPLFHILVKDNGNIEDSVEIIIGYKEKDPEKFNYYKDFFDTLFEIGLASNFELIDSDFTIKEQNSNVPTKGRFFKDNQIFIYLKYERPENWSSLKMRDRRDYYQFMGLPFKLGSPFPVSPYFKR